jgi:hypothetical protein
MAEHRYIIDKKSESKGLILLVIPRTDGRVLKVSMRITIDPMDWDKKKRRSRYDTELNIYLDTIHTMVNEYLIKCRNRFCPIDDRIKPDIHAMIAPARDASPPRTYDKAAYFKRFHEIMGNYPTMKAAYEQVESEWNDAGVSFCTSFDSFKVNKFRFLRGQRKHRMILL